MVNAAVRLSSRAQVLVVATHHRPMDDRYEAIRVDIDITGETHRIDVEAGEAVPFIKPEDEVQHRQLDAIPMACNAEHDLVDLTALNAECWYNMADERRSAWFGLEPADAGRG